MLAHQALISQLKKPSSNSIKALKACLENYQTTDFLLGADSSVWTDPSTRGDLIALNPVYDFDHLTLWLIKAFLGLFHDLVGRWYKSPPGTEGADRTVVHYDDARLQTPAVVLSTFLASLLPVLSIVVLYLVESMPERLAIVAVFTSTFSVALALVTTATRVETFAATAAWVP